MYDETQCPLDMGTQPRKAGSSDDHNGTDNTQSQSLLASSRCEPTTKNTSQQNADERKNGEKLPENVVNNGPTRSRGFPCLLLNEDRISTSRIEPGPIMCFKQTKQMATCFADLTCTIQKYNRRLRKTFKTKWNRLSKINFRQYRRPSVGMWAIARGL
ncbi:hypothetical protein DPMN_124522 [Dreissena polymorpha]|uniref:Uncharacterized protein n=1 Tax=Dreissena polymorpha TaxID=45954 RepID=A0A9D4GTP4_DREPO|nr:hypothetical protein DPMN_124522 [Dreissena polymorpha]